MSASSVKKSGVVGLVAFVLTALIAGSLMAQRYWVEMHAPENQGMTRWGESILYASWMVVIVAFMAGGLAFLATTAVLEVRQKGLPPIPRFKDLRPPKFERRAFLASLVGALTFAVLLGWYLVGESDRSSAGETNAFDGQALSFAIFFMVAVAAGAGGFTYWAMDIDEKEKAKKGR